MPNISVSHKITYGSLQYTHQKMRTFLRWKNIDIHKAELLNNNGLDLHLVNGEH